MFTSLLLTACGGTTVLKASFENDTTNGSPNASLPGDPAGDSMTVVGQLNNKVVYWDNSNTKKAVQISATLPGFIGLELKPAPGDTGNRYVLAFNAYAQNIMNTKEFIIRARTSPFDFGLISEMKFSNGKIFVKNGSQYQAVNIRDYTIGDKLVILYSVDFEKNEFNSSVVNSDVSQNNIGHAPTISLASSTGTGTGIYFQIGFEGGSGPGIFVVDEFNIIKYGP